MKVKTEYRQFTKDMKNLIDYSIGFLDGARVAEPKLLNRMGKDVVERVKEFIDSNARQSPEALHHVYEWYRVGSPEARLFEISYTNKDGGLTINATMSQSKSIKSGSNVPFYNKASIMEKGLPVTITPRRSSVLAFQSEDGATVFSSSPIQVDNPGGAAVAGGFEKIFNMFFSSYFSQSYLMSSGIFDHIKKPTAFAKNLPKAKSGGKAAGYSAGYNWMSQSGVDL
jgi:hypothetical protein